MSPGDIQDVEEFALALFADLLNPYRFGDPQIRRCTHATRIVYFGREIGIEIELDWYEQAAFLLVVLLERGGLPDGYYVSHGRACRKHLATVLAEQKWDVPEGPYNSKRSQGVTTEDLKAVLLSYKDQLRACIEQLVAAGTSVF